MESENCATNSKPEGAEIQNRWPDRRGWDVLAQSIETLAKACGGSAQCHKKYEYLSVSLEKRDMSDEQYQALSTLAELVEQVSDAEDHGDQSTVHWVRQALASSKRL